MASVGPAPLALSIGLPFPDQNIDGVGLSGKIVGDRFEDLDLFDDAMQQPFGLVGCSGRQGAVFFESGARPCYAREMPFDFCCGEWRLQSFGDFAEAGNQIVDP